MITVELSPYEARSLVRAAGWLDGIVDVLVNDTLNDFLPAGHSIPPLQSATMKLETALAIAQEEIS